MANGETVETVADFILFCTCSCKSCLLARSQAQSQTQGFNFFWWHSAEIWTCPNVVALKVFPLAPPQRTWFCKKLNFWRCVQKNPNFVLQSVFRKLRTNGPLILKCFDIQWRRKWQPTPVSMPGKSHGPRSLVGYNPWGRKESDMTERLLCVWLCQLVG